VSFPTYSIIQLKRFRYDDSSHNIQRVDTIVEDLPDRFTVSFGEHQIQYELVACICHRGTASSGHYVTWIRSGEASYNLMDDSKISLNDSNASNDMASNGYILLYRCTKVS
jgi:ubiquitin C-terminal hydrolase